MIKISKILLSLQIQIFSLGAIQLAAKEKIENINIFCEAIKFLVNKYCLTKVIEKDDIILSVNKNIEQHESNVKSFKQLIKTPRKSVIARSEKQSDYIKALKESDIVLSLRSSWYWEKFFSSFSSSNDAFREKN